MARAETPPAGDGRLIKRYENRKLYDPAARRYVTLEDLAKLVAKGEDVRVEDQKTGEDITTLVLAQVVLEGIRQRTASIPRQVLMRLIRLGSSPAAWSSLAAPQELAVRARDEAERIASGLLGRGRLSIEDALALRQEIARSVQRLVGEAQRGLEARIQGLIAGSESEAGASLHSLRDKLMALETYLARPAGAPRGRRAAPAGTKGARGRRR